MFKGQWENIGYLVFYFSVGMKASYDTAINLSAIELFNLN